MRSSKCWLIFFGVIFLQNCFAAPALSNPVSDNEDLTNSIEEESDEGEEEEEDDSLVLDEDDFTTHGLERLSSAATCLVAGVEYTHGQQIYRKDQCEFCLCLDGEMFCWWQDCPPTMEGPCKDRGPFSPCMSIPANPQYLSSSSLTTTSDITTGTNVISTSNSFNKITTKASSSTRSSIAASVKSPESSTSTERTSTDISSRPPESSTSAINKYCVIMGREYQVGDKLPHDTGNCLECICGQGAKVTCSPHQCAPVEDDMNDYHMSGARQPAPDIF